MKNCKKCGDVLKIRNEMFHYGIRSFTGLVCQGCKALWDNPDDSFFDYLKTMEIPQGEQIEDFIG